MPTKNTQDASMESNANIGASTVVRSNFSEVAIGFSNDRQLLTINDVMLLVGISRTTIWRLEKRGEFPARVRIGARRVAWRRDEILRWIEARPTI